MNDLPAPALAQLELARKLLVGLRAEELAALSPALGQAQDVAELPLARVLLRAALAEQVKALATAPSTSSVATREDPSREMEGRASLLMRLTTGGEQAGFDLARLEDLRTLMAVVRAGNLAQRRAAVLRVSELLLGNVRLPADQARRAIRMLNDSQAIAIGYELWLACSRLPGAEGKRARVLGQDWEAQSARFEEAVKNFWDGAVTEEPSAALADDDRAQLLMRARDLPDLLARHLCAVIAGTDGVSDLRARAALLGALRYAGDARLLPALRDRIISAEPELLIPAARALGQIEDARAHAALEAAYACTSAPEQRLALAGALGVTGDARALSYVQQVLASGDERLLPYALEALAEVGGRDDAQSVLELLDRTEPELLMAAVRTLGRIGDGRVLLPLRTLAKKAESPALYGLAEEAVEMVTARMELLGEEAPAQRLAAHGFDTTKRAALVRRKDPSGVRMRARAALLFGHGWLLLGATTRAIARFETAAALRPEWVTPVLELAMAHARRKDNAQALASFRRALGIDRAAIERSTGATRLLAQAFLRRVEVMERDGRDDVARGLLEEALSLDLRRVPSDLRFALEQARDAQRSKR